LAALLPDEAAIKLARAGEYERRADDGPRRIVLSISSSPAGPGSRPILDFGPHPAKLLTAALFDAELRR